MSPWSNFLQRYSGENLFPLLHSLHLISPLSLSLWQTEWLIWYAIESDYIMLFSLIREWLYNYFSFSLSAQWDCFQKRDLVSLPRYHYSFWSQAFSHDDYTLWVNNFPPTGTVIWLALLWKLYKSLRIIWNWIAQAGEFSCLPLWWTFENVLFIPVRCWMWSFFLKFPL